MTVSQAMQQLETIGALFRLDGEGNVKVSFPAGKPSEASALLEIARRDRSAAADHVRRRQVGAGVANNSCVCSVLDALAIAQAVKRGDALLLAPVIFHREPVNVTVCWEPVSGTAEAVLELHRERLLSAMKGRIAALERQPLDGLSAEEVEALSDKYSLYKVLVELTEA